MWGGVGTRGQGLGERTRKSLSPVLHLAAVTLRKPVTLPPYAHVGKSQKPPYAGASVTGSEQSLLSWRVTQAAAVWQRSQHPGLCAELRCGHEDTESTAAAHWEEGLGQTAAPGNS